MSNTDTAKFICELGAGVTEEKLGYMISDVARAVVAHDKQGEVSIKLKFKKLGDSDQVQVEHTVAYKKPKKRGSISEDDSQDTPFYVNEDNTVTIFPANQMDMLGKGSLNQVKEREDS